MIKKACSFILRNRIQFLRYLVVGFSGVFLDIGTLYVFSRYFGINPTLSVIANQAIVLLYNFTLNRLWTFSAGSGMAKKQVIRYGILASCNYVFSVGSMYVLNEKFGFDEILVRMGSIAVMTLWNFLLYKKWVYRQECE